MLWPVRTNYFYVAQSFTYYQKSLIAVFRWAPFNMRCVCMSFVLIIWLISISFHFIISKLLKSYEHNISKSLTIDMSSSAKLELSTFFSTKKNLQRWILKILFISAFFIVYLCELFFFFLFSDFWSCYKCKFDFKKTISIQENLITISQKLDSSAVQQSC